MAAEWKENDWTHVESTGCHSGLLSEGHQQNMRLSRLNGTAVNEWSGNGNKHREFQETKIKQRVYENLKGVTARKDCFYYTFCQIKT